MTDSKRFALANTTVLHVHVRNSNKSTKGTVSSLRLTFARTSNEGKSIFNRENVTNAPKFPKFAFGNSYRWHFLHCLKFIWIEPQPSLVIK